MHETKEYPDNSNSSCLFCRWIRAGRAVETLGSVAAFNDGYPVTDGRSNKTAGGNTNKDGRLPNDSDNHR